MLRAKAAKREEEKSKLKESNEIKLSLKPNLTSGFTELTPTNDSLSLSTGNNSLT
jgi:hypothetical protein